MREQWWMVGDDRLYVHYFFLLFFSRFVNGCICFINSFLEFFFKRVAHVFYLFLFDAVMSHLSCLPDGNACIFGECVHNLYELFPSLFRHRRQIDANDDAVIDAICAEIKIMESLFYISQYGTVPWLNRECARVLDGNACERAQFLFLAVGLDIKMFHKRCIGAAGL